MQMRFVGLLIVFAAVHLGVAQPQLTVDIWCTRASEFDALGMANDFEPNPYCFTPYFTNGCPPIGVGTCPFTQACDTTEVYYVWGRFANLADFSCITGLQLVARTTGNAMINNSIIYRQYCSGLWRRWNNSGPIYMHGDPATAGYAFATTGSGICNWCNPDDLICCSSRTFLIGAVSMTCGQPCNGSLEIAVGAYGFRIFDDLGLNISNQVHLRVCGQDTPNPPTVLGWSIIATCAGGSITDCNGNGIDDSCDVSCMYPGCGVPGCGQRPDCNHNGVPDECDLASGASADCNHNGVPDSCDIANGTCMDCNHNGVPDECDPWADCNNNGTFDGCDIQSGYSADCNANGVPDECESHDCNNNGVLDYCEPGGNLDCNLNGEPDLCDIWTGASRDEDADGIPDECEPCGVTELRELPVDGCGNGGTIAIVGDFAVAGEPLKYVSSAQHGAAEVFAFDGRAWNHQATLIPAWNSGIGSLVLAGDTMASDGNTVIMGGGHVTPLSNWEYHTVYVFEKPQAGWSGTIASVTSMGGDSFEYYWDDDYYGVTAVAIDNDPNVNTIAIGVPDGNDPNDIWRCGYVDLWQWDGLTKTYKGQVYASDSGSITHEADFGWAVAITADRLAVGAPYSDQGGEDAGVAYVYRRSGSTWVFEKKLLPPSPVVGGQFGRVIALDGDLLAVTELGRQRVYLLGRNVGGTNNWGLISTLHAGVPQANDYFGDSLSIAGETVVVSAPGESTLGVPLGRVYVYRPIAGMWPLDAYPMVELAPSDRDPNNPDRFGQSVAIHGRWIGVLASRHLDPVSELAGVYLYGGAGDCNADGLVDLCGVVNGFDTDVNHSGLPDECEPALGDANCDGTAGAGSLADINSFVLALSNSAAWQATYPGCDFMNCDINGDGSVNFGDINAFIALLSGP
jgi:hypothetical protein